MSGIESLWCITDVAAYLKKSERWMRGEVASGTLPHFRVGRDLRFEPERVQAFAKAEPAKVMLKS